MTLSGFVAVRPSGARYRYAKYSLRYEVVELFGGGRVGSASTLHLPFGDDMHQADACH